MSGIDTKAFRVIPNMLLLFQLVVLAQLLQLLTELFHYLVGKYEVLSLTRITSVILSTYILLLSVQ